MAHLKITEAQANALRALRPLKASDKTGYKDARRSLFANIRCSLGLPEALVMAIEVDDRADSLYGVVKARPPKSKSVAYAPLLAGEDGRYIDAAQAGAQVQWASLPAADVAALLAEQAESMENYKVVGPLTPESTDVVISLGDTIDGAALLVRDSTVFFRLDA